MKKIFLAVFLSILLVSCAKEPKDVQEPVLQTASVESERCFVNGEMVVQLSEEMAAQIEANGLNATKASAGFATTLDELGVVTFERLFPDAGEWESRHRAAGLHRWYRIVYDSKKESLSKAEKSLGDIDGVVYVEPVRRIKAAATFNDPLFSSQWDLFNDGSLGSKYFAGADINVVPVWENYTAGSNKVIVAVIDDGVDFTHEDIAASFVPAGPQGSKSFVYDYEGYNIYPGDHGTHVAGTIAAINNNGVGVCGIAGGDGKTPGARIMACQIFRDDPVDPDQTPLQGDQAKALIWAADHGAIIASNSWGYVYESAEEAAKGHVGTFGTAVDYFNRYAGCDKDGNQLPDSPMKGGLVVFAAGNEGWAHAWPAEYEGILSVGAMSSMMGKAYYSNYGDWVDICAPGGDYKVGPTIINCLTGDDYGFLQGTSMACPHVSGVAALVASYYGGPGFTREMLWDRLVGGANNSTNLKSQKIGPLVDALGAFTYGGTVAPDKVTDFTTSVQSNNVTMKWKVTADKDDGKAYGYMLFFSKNKSDLVSINPMKVPSTVKCMSVQTGTAEVGEEMSGVFTDLEFDTDYYCSIVAFDYSQNYSESSPVKAVHTAKNNPPVIETAYTGSYDVKTFEILRVEFSISDPDGHKYDVTTEPGSAAVVFSPIAGSTDIKMTITGRNAAPGAYTAHIVATDVYGASTDCAINYRILENHPPKVVSNIENILMGGTGETVALDMDKYFYDEDGEQLQYTFSYSTQNVAHCFQNGNTVSLSSMGYGVVEITITATDAAGKSCSTTFKVAVRDKSVPVSLYPNPVSTVLNVSTVEDISASIRVVSKAGATVREVSQNVSPFDPAVIDMKDCAAGVYTVVVKGGSIDGRYTIVKK